jgi:hypothetical protein
MWQTQEKLGKLYITDGTATICMGSNRNQTRRTAEIEINRRNDGGDPTKVVHDDKTILKLCHWGAKHLKRLFRIYNRHIANYDERFMISSMSYVRAIKYFKPNPDNGFTVYYQRTLWRIAHTYFIKETTTTVAKPLKPLKTGIKITDDMVKHTQRHTLGQSQPKIYQLTPIPYQILHARDAQIIKDIIENDHTFEKIAETNHMSRQRIHQIYKRGIQKLKNHYLAQ